ncbi:MAG TPA: J domain-containing protein, partial [Clostridia bacterium]|nr:J domain-containing protein [Clostridia bacterium]
MGIWEVLGIEPTNEVSAIKKAYAAKLKLHHPEDDPEGYQRLREAYDSAIKMSKNKSQEDVLFTYINTLESGWNDRTINNIDPLYDSIETNFIVLNEDFINKAIALYDDFSLRIDISKWNKLFDSDVIWNMNNREEINYLMLEFVSEHRYFPQDIWTLFNSTFNWKDQEAL